MFIIFVQPYYDNSESNHMLSYIILLVSAIAIFNILFIVFSKVTSNRRFRREQLELARITTQGAVVRERVDVRETEEETTANSFKAKGWELLSAEIPPTTQRSRHMNTSSSMVFSRVTSEHFR